MGTIKKINMNTNNDHKTQGVQTVGPLDATGNPATTDQRQEAIEQETDTERVRSERQSVADSKEQEGEA